MQNTEQYFFPVTLELHQLKRDQNKILPTYEFIYTTLLIFLLSVPINQFPYTTVMIYGMNGKKEKLPF